MSVITAKVGKKGTVGIPAQVRDQIGLEEGMLVIIEMQNDCILIKPAVVVPVEQYTLQRKAEFLLSNAVDDEDYARAVKEVRRMGLDPDKIPHEKPDENSDGAPRIP